MEVTIPFGGYKQSGIGVELGKYALDTFEFSSLRSSSITDAAIGILK
jgi:acyl-CoA reductase-like NAD-dependent aldehyde dehydrogenase